MTLTECKPVSLADRMWSLEQAHRTTLPRHRYTILRVDGRAFHGYLRGAERPYDRAFIAAMDRAAEALCAEIQGAFLAYTQSDEISIAYADLDEKTEPWFGGVVAKQLSIAASLAAVTLGNEYGGTPLFDARLISLADPVEVGNYFLWRNRDCVRNSITMAAQHAFGHKNLHKVNTSEMLAMLTEAGVPWDMHYDGCRYGRFTVKQTGERVTSYVDKRTGKTCSGMAVRTWWQSVAAWQMRAPHELDGRIPGYPDAPAPEPTRQET